jgi:PAB-dependent poly(A)-specific ribonuclease subunit 3
MTNVSVTLDSLTSKYSGQLRDAVAWLVSEPQPGTPKTIEHFMGGIASLLTNYMDAALHEADVLTSHLQRELENGRIARLLCKLGTINERGAFANDPAWPENGERYHLKLFRDYAFHQCDQEGKPVLDLGQMLSTMAKLDAGTEERIVLCSSDEQTVFLSSFRELKMMFERSFNELVKRSLGVASERTSVEEIFAGDG